MNTNPQKDQPVFSGVVAENYERYFSPMFFKVPAKDLVSRIPGEPGAILELACGTGQVTRLLKEKFPNAKITATDINPDMISAAKKAMNGGEGIEWKIMDAQEISSADNTYDVIVCQFGVMFFPDKAKSMLDAHRVLKPGGKYIFSSWDRIENQRVAEITRDIVLSYFKDDPPTFFNVPFSMYEPPLMEGLLKDAGFKDVSVKNVHLEGRSANPEEAAIAFTMGNPIYFAICERDESKLPEIRSDVQKKFTQEFGTESLRIPLSLWVSEGIK